LQSILLKTDGSLYVNGKTSRYCNPLSDGDILGMLLDMDNGVLRFSVNGQDHGVACQHTELYEGEFFI